MISPGFSKSVLTWAVSVSACYVVICRRSRHFHHRYHHSIMALNEGSVCECFPFSLISIRLLLATDGFPFISPRVHHSRTYTIYIERLSECAAYIFSFRCSLSSLSQFHIQAVDSNYLSWFLFFTFDPPVVDLSPSPWCKVVGGSFIIRETTSLTCFPLLLFP